MELNLSEPQTRFYISKAKYIAAVAGFGSGKTEVALTRMLSNMIEQPGLDQAYLAPTYPLIRDIWYPKVDTFLSEMGMAYRINKSEHVIYVLGLGKIYCRTMERPETIIGWEVGDAFLDEFDVLPIDKALHVFRKISARLRQKKNNGEPNRLYITTTPEGYKATYKLFKKEPLANSELIQMSTYSNEHNLPDDYIQGLKDQYPPQLIEAYLHGAFTNLTSGSVYPEFDRKTHDLKWTEQPMLVHMGLDFNVLNTAGIFAQIVNGKMHVYKEYTGVYDSPALVTLIKQDYPNGQKIHAYPDASGKNRHSANASTSDHSVISTVSTLRVSGANPAIKDRYMSVNNALRNGMLTIDVDACPILTESLEQQVFDKTGLPDKESGLDHPLDALGYMVYWHYKIVKPQFKIAHCA